MRGREIFETSKFLFQKVSEIAKWSAETKLTRAVLPNHSKKKRKKNYNSTKEVYIHSEKEA